MNVKWIAKIHWGRVLLIGLLFTVAATLVHMAEAAIMLPYYQMPKYFGVWSPWMMPASGPPPMEFFVITTIANFVTGLSLCIIYYYVRELLPKGFWKRTTYFADLMVATSFIFFTIPCLALFNLPYQLVISWFVSGFVLNLAAAFMIVKIIK